MVPRAVLDACVLYPQYLRDTLLRLANPRNGLYTPVWSAAILQEAADNLIENGVEAGRVHLMIGLMQEHFPEAQSDAPTDLVGRMTNHPKDRHVLATAVHAAADVLVTRNLRDFPATACEPVGVEVLDPDQFLSRLYKMPLRP